jgi:hypothetical protein
MKQKLVWILMIGNIRDAEHRAARFGFRDLNERRCNSATATARVDFGKDGALISRPKIIVINADSWDVSRSHEKEHLRIVGAT